MKTIIKVLSVATLLAGTSATAFADDITVRYNQIDTDYAYTESDVENEVRFEGPTVRWTGNMPQYNVQSIYGELGYMSEKDTPYEADIIHIGAGTTRNFYRNKNIYVDGSIGIDASMYDADGLDDSIYYLGVPLTVQFGVQNETMRGFFDVGYRYDKALNKDDDNIIQKKQPDEIQGFNFAIGIRYNFDYGWWTPKPNR